MINCKNPSFILCSITYEKLGYDPCDLSRGSRKEFFLECPSCGDIRLSSNMSQSKCSSLKCHICSLGSSPYRTDDEKLIGSRIIKQRWVSKEKELRPYSYRRSLALQARNKRRRRPDFHMVKKLRDGIAQALRRNQLKSKGKLRHLPYTGDEFVAHINGLLEKYEFKCPSCGCELYKYHIDHKTPISLGSTFEEIIGLFSLSNLDILCPSCNLSKSDNLDWKGKKHA